MSDGAGDFRLGGWTDVWMRGGWRVRQHVSGRVATVTAAGQVFAASPGDGLEEHVRRARLMAPRPASRRAAVLIHGLYHNPTVLSGMAAVLKRDGMEVANLSYSSARAPFGDTADRVARVAASLVEDGVESVCFVGHSLGGLLAREAAAKAVRQGVQVDGMVLIGSPARGARIAAMVARLVGPCRDVLVPAPSHSVALPVSRFLVIAGGTGGLGYNPLMGEDNDGVVAVSETALPDGQSRLVRAMHTPLARNPRTLSLASAFLASRPLPFQETVQ